MRLKLPRRTHELTEAARLLSDLGWSIERICLDLDASDGDARPKGTIVAHFDPPREQDVL